MDEVLKAKEENSDVLFTVRQDYTVLEDGQIYEFLKNRGCSSSSPKAEPKLSVKPDPKNDPLCYHGKLSTRIIQGYQFLYSAFRRDFLENSKIKTGRAVKYGIFSVTFKNTLIDPDSEEFQNATKYKVCPCYRLCHFGTDCHDWAFHQNLSLYVPIFCGNIMRNAKSVLTTSANLDPEMVKSSSLFKSANSKNQTKFTSESTKNVSRFTRILLEEGCIAKPSITKNKCLSDCLVEKDREDLFRHGWETDPHSSSDSDGSQDSISEKTSSDEESDKVQEQIQDNDSLDR